MSNLIKNPYQEFQKIPFKHLFGDFLSFSKNGNQCGYIHLNLNEDDVAYYIAADLPGVKGSDINVELDNDRLTISAKRECFHKDQKHHLEECFYGDFGRTIILPSKVDNNQVYANYKDGVLHISIHKIENLTPTKTINIHF
tara:strand:+ start:377 stop:799 length:423 start_codon:yes stop_codon:yes gene_type:complete